MRLVVVGVALALAVPQMASVAEAKPKRRVAKKSKTKKRPSSGCFKALKKLGVKYSKARRRLIKNGVRVRGPLGGVTYKPYDKKPLILDCSLVVSLAAAGRYLTAMGIDTAVYSSAYSIRNIRGTRHRSKHSYGLAIDVHSFTGDPVGKLVVKDHYEQGLGDAVDCVGKPLTQSGAMLRTVNCQLKRSGLFRAILDPDYDGDHYNHFHIEARDWADRQDDPVSIAMHRSAHDR